MSLSQPAYFPTQGGLVSDDLSIATSGNPSHNYICIDMYVCFLDTQKAVLRAHGNSNLVLIYSERLSFLRTNSSKLSGESRSHLCGGHNFPSLPCFQFLPGYKAIGLISISNKKKAGKYSPDRHKKTHYWRLSKNLFLWPKLANYSQ